MVQADHQDGNHLKHAKQSQLMCVYHTGQSVVMRDIKEKMKELNVQLDNLCQVHFGLVQ